jgi:RHS repeat-associated protein
VNESRGQVSNSANARVRTFTYDSLSRLACAANPEVQAVTCPASVTGSFPAGTITYKYDNDGNLVSKGAPSPNQPSAGTAMLTTTYTYDTLNRLTGKNYNDAYNGNLTPAVTYGYDGAGLSSCPTPIAIQGSGINGIGRRTAMCYAAGNKSWSYDPMGRIATENDRFIWLAPPYSPEVTTYNGAPLLSENTIFSYYLNGDLSNTFYPGPKGPPDYEFYTDENAAGQVTNAGDIYYTVLNDATYAPTGQLASVEVGWTDGSFTGNVITNTYNKRLQPVLVSAATPTGTSILNLTYNFNLGSGDNGNVIQIANGKDSNRTQNFTYDSLNRIASAYTNGTNWGENYTIDAWANLTNIGSYTGKSGHETLNCAAASTNNQLTTCYQYDAAGNRNDNGNFVYDAENRLIATSSTSYVYDGDGNRVEKCTEGATAGTCTSNGTGMLYWKSLDGGTLAESDLGGNWTAVYGLIRGQIGSRVDLPANVVHYYFEDHLKTTDIVTAANGGILKESDYYPYGGEILIINNDSNRYKFTGKERDTESNLDEFGARYYASSMGRFMTSDWAAKPVTVPYANFGNPQSLNLYSYVENNPTTMGDPDGHCPPCWGGALDGVVQTAENAAQTFKAYSGWANDHPNAALLINGAVVAGAELLDMPVGEIGAREMGAGAVSSELAPAVEGAEAASTITENAARGADFEKSVVAATKATDANVAEQVTLKTESGVKTRMDVVSTKASGGVRLQEAKSSASAPLTKNQKLAHPEIAKSGATVVGQGKPGYPGGTKISPTKVEVVRPKQQ